MRVIERNYNGEYSYTSLYYEIREKVSQLISYNTDVTDTEFIDMMEELISDAHKIISGQIPGDTIDIVSAITDVIDDLNNANQILKQYRSRIQTLKL